MSRARRSRLFPLCLACLAMCALAAPATGQPAPLAVRTASCEVLFDSRTGGITSVRQLPSGASIAGAPGTPLWRLTFRGGETLASTDRGLRFAADRLAGGRLRLTWRGPRALVVVGALPNGDHVDLTMRVVPSRQDVLEAALPADLSFVPSSLRRLIFPSDLGVALRPAFFQRAGPNGQLAPERIGPAGLQRIAGMECTLRSVAEAAVALTVPPAARALLGASLADRWQARRLAVSRPMARPPDLEVVGSAHGAYLAGYRVGKGWLVSFGGPLRTADGPLAIASVEHVLPSLRAAGRTRVVVLDLKRASEPSGWGEVAPATWREGVSSAAVMDAAGLQAATTDSVDGMLAALRDPASAVVINPYGESLPTGTGPWERVADTVRAFLQAGGVWVETGGYPFYSRLAARQYQSIEADYPGGFSDLAHVEAAGGTLALFGVQDDRQAGAVLVPAGWRAYADERGGHLERTWRAFVAQGRSWQSPPVRLLVGKDVFAAARLYADANVVAKALPPSVPPPLQEQWKRAVLVCYYGRNFVDETAGLDKLPPGSLVHVWDYLHGGFDKQYPDLLPPDPARGTPEQFAELLRHARSLGHLAMPYTNHTWWCDDPKGPTFAAAGDAPLLRALNGLPARETYGANWGWSICPWHPAVIAAAERIVDSFTRDYPVDVLFQDQVGARSWIWYDGNPASPAPWAVSQGWTNLSRKAGARIPLATEHGYDRLLGSQAEFCGLTWRLVPFETTPDWLRGVSQPYSQRYGDDTWEVFPLAQVMAGGNAYFTYHLGGPFTANRQTLSWAILLGFQTSLYVSTASLTDPWQHNWLCYLDRVQKVLGPRLMGSPLLSFRYLKGSGAAGVMEAVFGGGRVVANLTSDPWPDGDVVIAPMGFHATAPGVEAGILAERRGVRYQDELWLVSEDSRPEASLSVYGRGREPVTVQVGADAHPSVDPPAALAAAQSGTVALGPAEPAPAVPSEWTQKAPLERARPPRSVGIVAVDPDAPGLYAWTSTPARAWLDAMAASEPLRAAGVSVRPLGSAAELADAVAHPEDWLAIVNPYGEAIPTSPERSLSAMASAVRGYVRAGGLWFDTGGYPLFQTLQKQDGQWRLSVAGVGGMQVLGLSGCAIREADEEPVALEAGDAGRQWLGDDWAAGVRGRPAVANRPPLREDYEAVILRARGGRPYLTGHQLGGWGWYFRFGGGWPDRPLALDAVRRLVEALWKRPLARLPVRSVAPDVVTLRYSPGADRPQERPPGGAN